jgi:hypothetical protein
MTLLALAYTDYPLLHTAFNVTEVGEHRKQTERHETPYQYNANRPGIVYINNSFVYVIFAAAPIYKINRNQCGGRGGGMVGKPSPTGLMH